MVVVQVLCTGSTEPLYWLYRAFVLAVQKPCTMCTAAENQNPVRLTERYGSG